MLTVYINGRLIQQTGLSCSNIRRGGYESCTFQYLGDFVPHNGDTVTVYLGLSVVWQGYIDEVGITHDNGARGANVSAIGFGAKLKNNSYSMVYIDRDLNRWTGPSLVRQSNLTIYNPLTGPEIVVDPVTHQAGLQFSLDGIIASRAHGEALYDAGVGNMIAKVYWSEAQTMNVASNANWTVNMDAGDATIPQDGLSGTFGGGRTLDVAVLTTQRRYLNFLFRFVSFSTATVSRRYTLQGLAVLGDHGIEVQGAAYLEYLNASDVVSHALEQAGLFWSFNVDPNAYAIRNLAYYTSVDSEQVINDIAVLTGWSYGTWSSDLFGDVPTFGFYAPPVDVTCSVRYADCQGVDINEKLSELYNACVTMGTDMSGSAMKGSASKDHPGIPSGETRTLLVDVGQVGSISELDTLAEYYLALSQDTSRSAGSISTLPPMMLDGKPSLLLRAGIDRIQILGLPTNSSIIAANNSGRGDAFQVNRVTVTENADGTVQTTIEVDSGADLTETLNARLAGDTLNL